MFSKTNLLVVLQIRYDIVVEINFNTDVLFLFFHLQGEVQTVSVYSDHRKIASFARFGSYDL